MEGFENKISGYVKNLIQIRENNGHIFMVKDDSEVSLILNTSKFINDYFESLITDIGLFQNLSQEKIADKLKLYVEPDLSINKNIITRKELLQNINQGLLIIGRPGYGKSSLINKTILDCLEGELHYFPIYIRLSEYSYMSKELLDLIFLKFTNEKANGENLFNAIYQEKEILICLDGLDEVQSRKKRNILESDIFYLKKQFPEIKLIITSRPLGDYYPKTQLQEVELEGFQKSQADKLISLSTEHLGSNEEVNALFSQIKSKLAFSENKYDFELDTGYWSTKSVHMSIRHGIINSELLQLDNLILTNPLILSFIIEIVINKNTLPSTISEVYEKFFELNLNKWNAERKEDISNKLGITISNFEWINLCNWIASSFFQKEQLSVSIKELYIIIKDFFEAKNYPTINYEEVIEVLISDFGFINKNNNLCHFFHTSVLEYCYAQHFINEETDEKVILDLFFIKKQKEVGYHYFNSLSSNQEITFLEKGISLAYSFILEEKKIIKLFEEIEKELENISDNKERVFLFFFILSTELLKDVSSALTHISLTILEELLNNFYNIDIYSDANYIYTPIVNRYEAIAICIDQNLALDISSKLKLNYPDGKIDNEELINTLGIDNTIKLCSYYYILERIMFMNQAKSNIDLSNLLVNKIPNGDSNNRNLEIDFFNHNERYRYALLEEDFNIAERYIVKTLEDVTSHPSIYINASVFYQDFGVTGKYKSLELLENAINDISNNTSYDNHMLNWIVASNKKDFISELYKIVGTISANLVKEVIHDKNNETHLRNCYYTFSLIPREVLKYPDKSYFAYVLYTLGIIEEDEKERKYKFEYSLVLYLQSISEAKALGNDYISGYINSVDLSFLLEKYEEGKKLLDLLREKVDTSNFDDKKEIKDKVIELEVLYENL